MFFFLSLGSNGVNKSSPKDMISICDSSIKINKITWQPFTLFLYSPMFAPDNASQVRPTTELRGGIWGSPTTKSWGQDIVNWWIHRTKKVTTYLTFYYFCLGIRLTAVRHVFVTVFNCIYIAPFPVESVQSALEYTKTPIQSFAWNLTKIKNKTNRNNIV